MTVSWAQTDLPPEMDRERFQRMLSVVGDALRPVLVAQLLDDLERLRRVLGDPGAERPDRAAHELKGLSATMGDDTLAALAGQFETALAGGAEAQTRTLRQVLLARIDALARSVRAEVGPAVQA